jgi:hypothetical protein
MAWCRDCRGLHLGNDGVLGPRSSDRGNVAGTAADDAESAVVRSEGRVKAYALRISGECLAAGADTDPRAWRRRTKRSKSAPG